jgi:uncharacterized membrane protein YGL010W
MSTLVRSNWDKSLRHACRVHLRFYRSQHRTVGCRATHMIGVPMIVVSLLVLPFNWKASAQLQIVGWILQFIGHSVFEHNKPVLLEMRDPITLWAALVFVFDLWRRLIRSTIG